MNAMRVADIPSDEELRAFYNAQAEDPRYQARMYEAGHRQDFERRLKHILSIALPFAPIVLELGCADGIITRWVAARALSVVGVEMARPAYERCQELGLSNVRLINDDLVAFLRRYTSLDEVQQFALALALDVLEHLHDPEETIGLLRDATDHVLASVPINETPNPDAFSLEAYHHPTKIGDGSGHIWCFRPDTFRALFERVDHYEDNGVTAIILGRP